MNPAASPCARRATTSSVMSGAAPQAALHSTKTHRAVRKIFRRSSASPSRPAVTRARAKVSAYPDTTHCTSAGEAPRSFCTVGSATATIVTSSRLMKPATSVTQSARHRRGSGSYASSWAPVRRSPAPDADAVTRSPLARPDRAHGPTGHTALKAHGPQGARPEQGEHVPRPCPAHTRHSVKRPPVCRPLRARGQPPVLARTTSRCGTVRSAAGTSLRGL